MTKTWSRPASAALLAAALTFTLPMAAFAHDPDDCGGAMMMGRNMGGGMPMGRAMMQGDGAEAMMQQPMRQGMMRGDGQMHSGMMRGDGGQAMMRGDGQMHPGMMQGRMGAGMPGRGAGMSGLFGARVVPVMNLSVEDVSGYLAWRLERLGNARLKLGEIKAEGDSITADIVTVDNSLVQHLTVDRHTGAIDYGG